MARLRGESGDDVQLVRHLRQQPVQFLVVVVAVDVVMAVLIRLGSAGDVFSGGRDWRSVLGLFALLYLFVVTYAISLVAREALAMRGVIHHGETALRAHAKTTREWLWETTSDLAVTYSSPQVEHMLGYSPDEVVGRDAHGFMSPSTARRSRAALTRGLAQRGWHEVRSEWLHADGHVVAISHSGEPIVDDSGRLLGFRGSGSVVRQDEDDARHVAKLRERVREVLDQGGLSMALQPIVDVATGRLVGVEALARFHDGRPPDVWFEEAGKAGLRAELEMLAITRAAARMTELPCGASMAVNACPEVVTDRRFVPMLLEAEIPLNRLVVEITEHARVEEYSALEAAVSGLRDLGVRLAVDDTGAGYASLAHVLRLKPDIIKLDRSLVSGIDSDGARRTLVTALVLLALDTGAVVTAEGVETPAELEAVAALGVDHAQGYLIARPSIDLSAWPAALRA